MLFSLIVIVICFAVFERGSNYLIEGLGSISDRFGISEAVLGASIAAMGSSAPEFASSVFSVAKGHPTIGLGTIFGSAIFNVTVIIGGAGILAKCTIERRVLYRDGLFYLCTVIIAILSVWDGVLSRFEAVSWTIIFFAYFVWLVYDARRGKKVPRESFEYISFRKAIAFLIFGLLAIGLGAHYLVIHVAKISTELGISEAIPSLVLVAIGTSVPDLFVSLKASSKGMGSMAVSNALGSNIFDILAGLGIPFSFPVVNREIVTEIDSSIIILLVSVILALALIRYKWTIAKREGAILVGAYCAYIAFILIF
ncbi:hypothetical protein AKJ62_03240 [candidate division MSBL1 archaeon SCGC-AAA259D14]|uniref:Sodium/calcium exchanger membrane region domain-containing protein n=1 Tax=candidate division MSBL1 archaeon SCGC-AAA259D14 TaxID=1698261 RepID=A0A133U5C3_9EURY|nr:hypothetical protein AKJ62_03240 [candidate division MSBL1 archaeon SCGC-AAA259D14]